MGQITIGETQSTLDLTQFQNFNSRVHFYTQFDNQIDIYNDIVSNGINPDSSSWDVRKTFELMKEPREEAN